MGTFMPLLRAPSSVRIVYNFQQLRPPLVNLNTTILRASEKYQKSSSGSFIQIALPESRVEVDRLLLKLHFPKTSAMWLIAHSHVLVTAVAKRTASSDRGHTRDRTKSAKACLASGSMMSRRVVRRQHSEPQNRPSRRRSAQRLPSS